MRWVPGFRTGKLWKQILAVVVYLLLIVVALAGGAPGVVLLVWGVLAAAAISYRDALPKLGRGQTAGAWAAFAVAGFALFYALLPKPAPPPSGIAPTPAPAAAAAPTSASPPTVAATVPALPTSAPTVAPTPTAPAPPPTALPPTATSVPPTAVTQPTSPTSPAVAAFQSGGLGLDRAEWEKKAGRSSGEQAMFWMYQNNSRAVLFIDGRVQHIERTWGDRNAVALDAARAEGKTLLPADARLVRTYTSQAGRTVDLYHSDGLADRFEGNWFDGGDPGDCIVIYRQIAGGRVTSIVVASGNNP